MDPLIPIPEYYEAELHQSQLRGKLAAEKLRRAYSAGPAAVSPQEIDELELATKLAVLDNQKAEAVLAFVQKYSPAAIRVLERQ
jgi:hypothetical protein